MYDRTYIMHHSSILDHVSCSTWLREDLSSDQAPSKQAIENEEKLIGTFKVGFLCKYSQIHGYKENIKLASYLLTNS